MKKLLLIPLLVIPLFSQTALAESKNINVAGKHTLDPYKLTTGTQNASGGTTTKASG